MDLDRGRSILTADDYVECGNSSGTVQFLVVTKDDIGESRLAIGADGAFTRRPATDHGIFLASVTQTP